MAELVATMDPPIDRVPDELLSNILGMVGSVATKDVGSCIRVSRRWSRVGIPILHRHLVITSPSRSVCSFFCHFHSSFADNVRTITLHLLPQFGDHDAIHHQLITLKSVLPRLRNLACFSLGADDLGGVIRVPAAGIADVLGALPQSCEHLEIDTGGFEVYDAEQDDHLCPSFRRVLPRMRNVRLVLGQLCSAMFGEGLPLLEDCDDPNRTRWRPIRMRHIETFIAVSVTAMQHELKPIIDFNSCLGDRVRMSGSMLGGMISIKAPNMWDSATESLLRVARDGDIPSTARLFVIGATFDRPDDRAEVGWPTLLRCDMASGRSWIMPITVADTMDFTVLNDFWDDARCARSEQPVEPLSLPHYIPMFGNMAEGQIWRTTNRDGRLPASLFSRDGARFAGECEEPGCAQYVRSRLIEYREDEMDEVEEIWW